MNIEDDLISIKTPAIKTSVCGNISFNGSVRVSDILELVRTPTGSDSWAKDTQTVLRTAHKKITESHEGLAMYLATNGAKSLDPVTIMYTPEEGMFEAINSADSNPIGMFSVNEDCDPILMNSFQQFNALYILKSGAVKGDLSQSVLDSELAVSFVPYESDSKAREIYRFLNRNFSDGQTSEFLSSQTSLVTSHILKSDLLRSTDGSNSLLVNTKSYSIPARSLMFLTARSIDAVHDSLFEAFPTMSLSEVTLRADEMWTEFLNIEFFHNILANPRTLRDVKNSGKHSALLKSIVMQSVFRSAAELINDGKTVNEAFTAILNLNLDISDPGVIATFFDNGRIKTSASDIDSCTKAISNTVRLKRKTIALVAP